MAAVTIVLVSDGSIKVPCPRCRKRVHVPKKSIYSARLTCDACEQAFDSPINRLPVRIVTEEAGWDMVVDDSWDLC